MSQRASPQAIALQALYAKSPEVTAMNRRTNDIAAQYGMNSPEYNASVEELFALQNKLGTEAGITGDQGQTMISGPTPSFDSFTTNIVPETDQSAAQNFNYDPDEYYDGGYLESLSGVGRNLDGSSGGRDPSDFFHSTGTTTYSDYDPATRTVAKSIGGFAGNIDAGRVNVDALAMGGSSGYDSEFAQAFQQFQASQAPTQQPTEQQAPQQFSNDGSAPAGSGLGSLSQPASQQPANMYAGQDTSQNPYVSGITRDDTFMDPYTQQLLYGLGGIGGFIPGAMRAAERTFFDDQGRPIVIGKETAGFSPDQIIAQTLARNQIGSMSPYLQESEQAFRGGLDSLKRGQAAQVGQAQRGFGELQRGARQESQQRSLGLEDALYGIDRNMLEQQAAQVGLEGDMAKRLGLAGGSVGRFGTDIDESKNMLRQTTDRFDPESTSRFYDPYEDQVVQQVIRDATERLTLDDIRANDRNIADGGQSAFGSRARLSAAERAKAMGEGLAKQLGNIRSQGYQRAQGSAVRDFENQQAARRSASSGLAGLSGQQFNAQGGYEGLLGSQAAQRYDAATQLGNKAYTLGSAGQQARGTAGSGALNTAGQLASGYGQLGSLYGNVGTGQLAAQSNFGNQITGLGTQARAAGAQDVSSMGTMGGQIQGQRQTDLNAQRDNLMQAQQAPLAQYNALSPYITTAVQAAGRGSQVRTNFAPPPDPFTVGLGTGLSALGSIGNYANPYGNRNNYQPTGTQPTGTQPTGTQPTQNNPNSGGGYNNMPYNPSGGGGYGPMPAPYYPMPQMPGIYQTGTQPIQDLDPSQYGNPYGQSMPNQPQTYYA